jgi:hypothetical protein
LESKRDPNATAVSIACGRINGGFSSLVLFFFYCGEVTEEDEDEDEDRHDGAFVIIFPSLLFYLSSICKHKTANNF